MIILAVETSCDETSIAIIKDNVILTNVISSQVNIHQQYGGVVPEIAARAHSDNIFFVLEQAINNAKINVNNIDYVAYTAKPGLISCLHVGQVIAQTIGYYLDKPLIACNHLSSHIYASIIDHEWKFPVLGLLVSGGHTQLLLLKQHLQFEIIGQTLDDAAGECYDKVARMLGFEYPGGPAVAAAAMTGHPTFDLPWPKKDQTLDFSFSGLKSACAKIIQQHANQKTFNRADFSSSLQNTINGILLYKLVNAIEKYQPATVVLAGGVSANLDLRTKFLQLKSHHPQINFLVPRLEYCTDNAAMVAILASYQIKIAQGES